MNKLNYQLQSDKFKMFNAHHFHKCKLY